MSRFSKMLRFIGSFVSFSLLCTIAPALADEQPTTSPNSNTPARKLHRGTFNAATGIAEAPKIIDQTWKEAGWFEALTYGASRGAGMAIARTAAGFYEMATFYLPAPKDYEPLMQPEYIDPSLNPSGQ